MTNRRRKIIKERLYRESNRCRYCGLRMSLDAATIDHKVPRSAGGQDHESNCTLACRSCNRTKGSRDAEAFRAVTRWKQARGLLKGARA